MTNPAPEEFGTESIENFSNIAKGKAHDALTAGKTYVRENPVPVILGAVILGAAVGMLLAPRERRPKEISALARELVDTVRDEITDQLPRLKKQYASTRDNLVDQVSDISSKLKWW